MSTNDNKELKETLGDRRYCSRGKGNAKQRQRRLLFLEAGLGRRWSAAGSARVSPVLGGGAAPPGHGLRQVTAAELLDAREVKPSVILFQKFYPDAVHHALRAGSPPRDERDTVACSCPEGGSQASAPAS